MSYLLLVTATCLVTSTSPQQTDEDGDQYNAAYDQRTSDHCPASDSDRHLPSRTTAALSLHLANGRQYGRVKKKFQSFVNFALSKYQSPI